MPLHDFECQACSYVYEKFVQHSELYSQRCPKCQQPVQHVFLSSAQVHGDLSGYTCPVTGKWIDGRKAHSENLKRQGCRVLETGEREALQRARAKEEAQFDRNLDRTIDSALESMPARKREKLFEEVAAGANISIDRQ